MILTLLLVLLILVCLALGAVVLLQQSEGGALGMGGGPSGFMTARGAGDLLTRLTWILGGSVFALCLALTILQGRLQGGASVVDRLRIDPLSTETPNKLPVAPAIPATPAGGPTGFEAPAPQVNGVAAGGLGTTSTTLPAVPARTAPPVHGRPRPATGPAAAASTAATPPAAPAPSVQVAPTPTPKPAATRPATAPTTNTGPTDPAASAVGGVPAQGTTPAPKTTATPSAPGG